MNDLKEMSYDIDSIKTQEDAIQTYNKVLALQKALEQVNEFHENSVKFALLEVEVLLKVIELDGISQLKGEAKKTAQWLSELKQDEIGEYIEKCKDGITIRAVWKYNIDQPLKRQDATTAAYEWCDYILKEAKETGIIELTDDHYYSMIDNCFRGVVNKDVYSSDIKNGLRMRLLKNDFVGVGNRSGTYVSKNSEDKTKILDAAFVRFEKAQEIFQSGIDLLEYSKTKIPKSYLYGRKSTISGYERLLESMNLIDLEN